MTVNAEGNFILYRMFRLFLVSHVWCWLTKSGAAGSEMGTIFFKKKCQVKDTKKGYGVAKDKYAEELYQ